MCVERAGRGDAESRRGTKEVLSSRSTSRGSVNVFSDGAMLDAVLESGAAICFDRTLTAPSLSVTG